MTDASIIHLSALVIVVGIIFAIAAYAASHLDR